MKMGDVMSYQRQMLSVRHALTADYILYIYTVLAKVSRTALNY